VPSKALDILADLSSNAISPFVKVGFKTYCKTNIQAFMDHQNSYREPNCSVIKKKLDKLIQTVIRHMNKQTHRWTDIKDRQIDRQTDRQAKL